ncbi:MAG: NAD-dependent epimerase/dehydratase family protein, partial [Pseudomonadota bacterium]
MPTDSATKTCLVIGGAGFIGTHLCRAIASARDDLQLTVLDDLSGSAVDRERFRMLVPEADLIVGDGAAPPRRVRETG